MTRLAVGLILVALATALVRSQAPSAPPSSPSAGQKPANPPPGGPGGQGRRGAVQVMTLSSSAWPDGGQIPAKHAQNGGEISPPFTWGNVPDGTASFVLIAHDLDAAVGNGTDDVLHWMLWNIPGAARGLPEAIAPEAELPDGTRQISASGPYYRGPGAASAGLAHHYAFELYALDATIEVAAVGQTPAQTRAAVMAAMAGRVRGKAAYVGLFKR